MRFLIYMFSIVVILIVFSFLLDALTDTPTIGGTNVPLTLDCEEDELIGFTGIDTLDCVHIDSLFTSEIGEAWTQEGE